MTMLRAALAAAFLVGVAATPALGQSLRPGASGTYGQVQLRAGFTPDPHSVSVQAGGTIDAAAAAGSPCTGMIAQRPDFTLRYRAGELPLYISVTSDVDTTLVVRAPNGVYACDDDSAGNLDPVVRFDAPASGRYQIWVGTFGAGSSSAPAMLHISELRAGGAQSQAAGEPDPSLDPAYGVVNLTSGFQPDPHTVAISAGGGYAASQLPAPGCTGYIAAAPDYRVNFTAGVTGLLPLIFSVAAEADTTLVVNTPDGQWHCDDDGGVNGLNPMLRFDQPQSGQYDIWVGTYAAGALQNSVLHVSELESQ